MQLDWAQQGSPGSVCMITAWSTSKCMLLHAKICIRTMTAILGSFRFLTWAEGTLKS